MESSIKAFNIIFKGLEKHFIFSLLENNKNHINVITPVNAELIVLANEVERFREILNKNISTIDGQIPYFFLIIRNQGLRIEKISGSDLIFDICRKASQLKLRVFLLGGLETSNTVSQQRLRESFPELIIDGYSPSYSPYPFLSQHNKKILNRLEDFSPDVLFVAFGAPKQEYWIEDNKAVLEKIGIRLAIAVGGTFELVAGIERRAPKFIQKIGLESIWRLYQNPKRFRRVIRSFKFFKYALLC